MTVHQTVTYFLMHTQIGQDEEILTSVCRGCECALTTSVTKFRVAATYMQSGVFRNRSGGIRKSLPLLHRECLSLNRRRIFFWTSSMVPFLHNNLAFEFRPFRSSADH